MLESIGMIIIPTDVLDTVHKIFLANIPTNLDDLTIIECLEIRNMGNLKAFHLVKNQKTYDSKGYAFFEY